ncbi:sensor histidine kinase [Flavitalea flava]
MLCFGFETIQAQKTDSLKKHLAELSARYQGHFLPDTVYLKGVDSAAPLLLNDDSLKELLSVYRQIAFGNKTLGMYRGKYYTYLAIFSYNMNKYGSAIYYSEKNNEEKIKTGVFEKEGIPHSDLFAITLYYNNKDYARVFSKYNTLLPVLRKVPAGIRSGKISPEQVFVVFGILEAAIYSAFKTSDTAKGGEGIRISESILEAIREQPDKFKKYQTFYDYINHTILFAREKYLNHYTQAQNLLQMALTEVRSGGFLKHLQPSYTEELYTEAFDFYFDKERKDSAKRYLDLVEALHDSLVHFSNLRQGFLLESSTKLLAGNGQYEAAYKNLWKLYQMSDSAFYAVTSDKDNNLYALAEAENTRNELLNSETKKKQAEQFGFMLFFIMSLLIAGGVAWFLTFRTTQKQRLLNLQLSIARNFHDEIGPMLLYANTLVKKESESNPSNHVKELKIQLMNIMEAVRGISHDLKSRELSTIQSFYKETATVLEKIKITTGIDHQCSFSNGDRVLSHNQYTNLLRIMNELISNSIKHSGCTIISIEVAASDKDLRIAYSDNGKGMEQEQQLTQDGNTGGGIGMQNMEERTALLNGSFHRHNNYPEGYSIVISIPLI